VRAGADFSRESRAIRSLLDVVEELAHAVGEQDWAELVTDTFNKHRAELRGEDVEWEQEQ